LTADVHGTLDFQGKSGQVRRLVCPANSAVRIGYRDDHQHGRDVLPSRESYSHKVSHCITLLRR